MGEKAAAPQAPRANDLVLPGFALTTHSLFRAPYSAPRIIEKHSIEEMGGGGATHQACVLATIDGEGHAECAICLGRSVEDPVTLICSGAHFYCKACIMSWFRTSISCPLCKEGNREQLLFFVSEQPTGRDSAPKEFKLFRVHSAEELEAQTDANTNWPVALRPKIRAAIDSHRFRFGPPRLVPASSSSSSSSSSKRQKLS